MSDIVERLRWRATNTSTPTASTPMLCAEAADEITRLRAEVEQAQMREACAADLAREWEQHCKRAEAEVEKLTAALKEIDSITVHSGGDIHGISPTAWRAAFGHAHAVARAALEGEA